MKKFRTLASLPFLILYTILLGKTMLKQLFSKDKQVVIED